MKLYLVLLLLLLSTNVFGQSMLEKIESAIPNKIEEPVLTYYSTGYLKVAQKVSGLLQNSTEYFESKFGVEKSFAVALIDSAEWIELTNIPYGLPFVSGPPYVVCIPASSDNVLSKLVRNSIAGSGLDSVYHTSDDKLVQLFVSLIGFHELGHMYAKATGIEFPNKWTFEFAATYMALLYLHKNNPEEAQIWRRISRILVEKIKPVHTTIEDFEKLYVRIGVENYAWYQVVFLMRAVEVQDEMGINFIDSVSRTELHNDNYSIHDLEEICPGFSDWANRYHLL